MDKFNKMQEGGVLKYQTGDKFIIPEYGSEKDFDEFILINEKFKPKTYRDAKGKLTLGYGLRQTYDEDLNPTPVKLGQTITEEEAKIQHERRKQLDMRQIKKRLPNFDLYPKGLQYAIRDMVFNSGETSTFNPNTKFMKALKAYDSSGDYSNWDSVKGIAKHIDWNLDTEGNLGVRAGMRRAMATEIYDWNDNKTIGKYHTNPKDKNYYVNSPYWQFGQPVPKTKGNKIKSKQLGGILKCQEGKPLKSTIKTDNYVAHDKNWGWWNSLTNIGDRKNHITFAKRNDLTPLNINNEKQYLLDWYQNENTLKRVKNLTGERIPESLRRGTFINMYSNAYVQDKEDSNLKESGGSYFMRGIGYNPEGRNYIVFNKKNSQDSELKVHEANHSYNDLHINLFNGLKKYRPSQRWLDWQSVNESGADPEYLTTPTEIHSRLMEVRRYLNKKPGESITADELDDAIRNLDGDNHERLIGNYNREAFLYWLNTIASNNYNTQEQALQYAHNGIKLTKKRF